MKKNGFTLIEIILAIFILTIALVASFVLIQQSMIGAFLNQSQLTAYHLGQEGIEIVRNIRDTYLLGNGSDISAGDWEVDYQSSALELWQDPGRYLKVDGSGFYNYSSGSNTKFKRKITLEDKVDFWEIEVIVSWEDRGASHNISVINHLYDWYGI
jgi:prepilin-type N-terminal cleavage/methylation domain-containing protein